MDNELKKTPRLGDMLYEYNVVDEPNKILMAGKHTLVGTGAWILPGLFTHDTSGCGLFCGFIYKRQKWAQEKSLP